VVGLELVEHRGALAQVAINQAKGPGCTCLSRAAQLNGSRRLRHQGAAARRGREPVRQI
jgi:hypothetical protein